MWSSIYLDYNYHTNFNVNFSSHKNDIHIHLSQWQYWWWFWFALLWSLYFLVILRLVVLKTANYNINFNTSLRSHGKWGDFLVATIPLTWCGSILVNSNFILRMIEWQNEGSLFTIRIQGKQWYWVYKFNADTNYRLNNVYINIGNNNWSKTASSSKRYFINKNSTLLYVFEYEFKKIYRTILGKQKLKNSVHQYSNNLENIQILSNNNNSNNYFPKLFLINSYKLNNYFLYNNDNNLKINYQEKNVNIYNISNKIKLFGIFKNYNDKLNNIFNINTGKFLYELDKFEDVEETAKNLRLKNSNFSIKLIKGILNKHNKSILNNNINLEKNILFNYRIDKSEITPKISQIEQFWGFRQKRKKKLKSYSFSANKKFDNVNYQPIESFTNNKFNKYNFYNSIKNNKHKTEMISTTLAKRLLRTKRTLILPAHVNITLITSSYDVVHSWFVPGLGLKIDCVPGRSTHHSLYIDNIGFYYGQCAEICGRYHHHMPIRVCALNYEHFLVWWQTKGMPRLYRSNSFQKKSLINQ